jgi:hypothetical protein
VTAYARLGEDKGRARAAGGGGRMEEGLLPSPSDAELLDPGAPPAAAGSRSTARHHRRLAPHQEQQLGPPWPQPAAGEASSRGSPTRARASCDGRDGLIFSLLFRIAMGVLGTDGEGEEWREKKGENSLMLTNFSHPPNRG